MKDEITLLQEYLECPCQVFPADTDAASIVAAYWASRARGEKEGFVPILLAPDDILLESLTMNLDGKTPKEYRQEILKEPVENGDFYFSPLLEARKRLIAGMMEEDAETAPEELFEGEAIRTFYGICAPMLLAEIPVKNPWEVFAYLPFGGWNDCPDTPGLMSAAKTWYEAHGAIPAIMTHDILQFAVPAPVEKSQALSLAWEQYVWCPDIVDQGCGIVEALASTLCQSTVWFFWWD